MCVCEFYVCECMYELMGVYVQVHVFYILIACCMFTNNLRIYFYAASQPGLLLVLCKMHTE